MFSAPDARVVLFRPENQIPHAKIFIMTTGNVWIPGFEGKFEHFNIENSLTPTKLVLLNSGGFREFRKLKDACRNRFRYLPLVFVFVARIFE